MKNRDGLENSNHWETPKPLKKDIYKEFSIDFDPCPLNADFDGMALDWGKSNFINPPYSKGENACNPDRAKCNKKSCIERGYHIDKRIAGKDDFIKKAFLEWKKGKTCVLLIPVSTGTDVFHNYIFGNAEVRFFHGRLKFAGYNTKGEYVINNVGKHDSMLVIFRAHERSGKFLTVHKEKKKQLEAE